MKTYFSIAAKPDTNSLGLKIDYSIKTVPDPSPWFKSGEVPQNFLAGFKIRIVGGGKPQDMLSNTLGWHIFSPRMVEIIKSIENADDVRLMPLPATLVDQNEKLRGYCVFGVNRQIECVNVDRSEILWGEILGKRYVSSFRKCVLDEKRVPRDVGVFLLQEYPVMVVFSPETAMKIAELRPSGFVFHTIEAH